MRIIEIIDRSTQGITNPFICRGEDGAIYYVKGRHAGYRALCCEWVAGELARLWGLPIAPFTIVEVPAALIQGSILDGASDLGIGPAFGSRQIEAAVELRWNEFAGDTLEVILRAHILLFDWWVDNPDRTEGNPNLLWVTHEQQLRVIDHNLAFSPHMMPSGIVNFTNDHIFGVDLITDEYLAMLEPEFGIGPLTQAGIELERFWDQHRAKLPQIWDSLPEVWTEATPDFTLEAVQNRLDRIQLSLFWEGNSTTESDKEG